MEGETKLILYLIADSIYTARNGDKSLTSTMWRRDERDQEARAEERAWLARPLEEFPEEQSFQWWCELLKICPIRAQRLALKHLNRPQMMEEHRGRKLFVEATDGPIESPLRQQPLRDRKGRTKRLRARLAKLKESKRRSSSQRSRIRA